MYSMKDAVLDHAKKLAGAGGTYEGLELLELETKPENNSAANLYIVALSIIYKLMVEHPELFTK